MTNNPPAGTPNAVEEARKTAGRTTEIAKGAYYHEAGIDYTDGYRVTVGWSEEDKTWVAGVAGTTHCDKLIADGPTKEAALLSMICAMANVCDALEDESKDDVVALATSRKETLAARTQAFAEVRDEVVRRTNDAPVYVRNTTLAYVLAALDALSSEGK